jgi:N utilization substance protein B
MERALAIAAGRLLDDIPYWQEVRFERSLRTKIPGMASSPHLYQLVSDAYFLPGEGEPGDALALQLAALMPAELARYRRFVDTMRSEVPRVVDSALRKAGLERARDLAARRAAGAAADDLPGWLSAERRAFGEVIEDRWHRVSTVVHKQVGDWLRTAAFTVKLVEGTYAARDGIDTTVSALASGWRLERQVSVDRNIMRLAAFEMLFVPGIPTGASINEAVELAKKYSTSESGRFVNGVLGALANQVGDKLAAPEVWDARRDQEVGDSELDVPDIVEIEETDTE